MLTLTRRAGERIVIGGNIEVSVVEVGRGRVRISIEAPRELAIHRGEVLDRMIAENRRAAGTEGFAGSVSPEASPIVFSSGLLGLGEHTRFWLADIEGIRTVRSLVSVIDPSVRLSIVDAGDLADEYPVELVQGRDGAPSGEEIAVAVIASLPPGGEAMVNLRAPIVIGLSSRRAAQVVLDEREDLGFRAPLRLRGGARVMREPAAEGASP